MPYLSVFSGGLRADELESKQQEGTQDTEKEKIATGRAVSVFQAAASSGKVYFRFIFGRK